METESTRVAPGTRAGLAAPVMEVFTSIQGEGLHAGQPQVFLRLFGCPLRCRWCDTPGSWTPAAEPTARIVPAPDAAPRREPGWATAFQAATWVAEVDATRVRPVSVTGGEPLLWPGFLRELRALVAPRRVHLETAGGHPLTLGRVLDAMDHVSLDLKLPADLDPPVAPGPTLSGAVREEPPTDEAEWAAARVRALALLAGAPDACAKLVVAGGRRAAEFLPLLDDVARLAPELPLFLQPVTPAGGVLAPERALLEELVEEALERGLRVRLVPQIHRALRLP